jgi:hypothetical protein
MQVGWTVVTKKKNSPKMKATNSQSDLDLIAERQEDVFPALIPEVVLKETNFCPETTTGRCASPAKSSDTNDMKVCEKKELNNTEIALSRFPSPTRKRRAPSAQSIEAATGQKAATEAVEEVKTAAQVVEQATTSTEDSRISSQGPATYPTGRTWRPSLSRAAPVFAQAVKQVVDHAKVSTENSGIKSQAPLKIENSDLNFPVLLQSLQTPRRQVPPQIQTALESPSKSMAVPADFFSLPGTPKTNLQYQQILASNNLSPLSASLDTCDDAQLKLLISKGAPGLDPPRASEIESARSLLSVAPSWATIAAGGSNKKSEDAQSKSEMMNLVLMECFLQAISTRVMAWNLPIKGTTLYTQHMRPCRRIGTSLNVRESTYHYFGAFLTHLETLGLLRLKKGETDAVIEDICRDHPEILSWQPWPDKATVEDVEKKGIESSKRDF